MLNKNKIKIENLKTSDLKKFKIFVKKFYRNKIIVKKKFYKSSVFNKGMMDYLFKKKNSKYYNFKIIKKANNIVGIHGYIPQNQFDSKLKNSEIFLGLLIGKKKLNFPIFPLTYNSIISDKKTFIGSVNPYFTPFLKLKKFQVKIMSHNLIISKLIKKFNILKIGNYKHSNIKLIRKDLNYKFLTKKELINLNTKHIYNYQIPLKSDKYIINRYINHPFYKYFIVGIFKNKNKLKIILVLRKINIKNSNVLRIVDLFGRNEDIPIIKNTLIELLKIFNSEFVDIYSFGIPEKILEKSGFINRFKFKNLIVPNYFEPLISENVDLKVGFISKKVEKVRIFKGDCDQDHSRKI